MIEVVYDANYKTGNKLTAVDRKIGWVEWLQSMGKVYHCVGPKQVLYKNLYNSVTENVCELILNGNSERVGIIKSLANERLTQTFILPPMLSVTDTGRIELNVGTCRVMAEIMCGTPKEEWSLVVYSTTDDLKSQFDSVMEIPSTQHYIQLYNLAEIDHQISMICNNSQIRFINSVVRYGLYDNTDRRWTLDIRKKSKLFFDRLKKNNKVQVQVHCTRDVEKFIPTSNEHFEFVIVHEPQHEWQFSYGRLLSAYCVDKNASDYVLNLWVYDITEPLCLESLILWLDTDHSAYYTKNRKVVVFATTHITSIKEIGNFVK